MTNGTLVGLIVGSVLTLFGVFNTGLTWRRLHRGGERPNIVFWLFFIGASFGLAASIVSVISTIYEFAGSSPFRTTSLALLGNGGTWMVLSAMSERLFEQPQLPGPPSNDSLPTPDGRTLPPG